MDSTKKITMDEVKMRLLSLSEHHLKDGRDIYQFGQFLATHLTPVARPESFVLGCKLALEDLRKGINGYTNTPIHNGLTRRRDVEVYGHLENNIPLIAELAFSKEFAQEVRIIMDK